MQRTKDQIRQTKQKHQIRNLLRYYGVDVGVVAGGKTDDSRYYVDGLTADGTTVQFYGFYIEVLNAINARFIHMLTREE